MGDPQLSLLDTQNIRNIPSSTSLSRLFHQEFAAQGKSGELDGLGQAIRHSCRATDVLQVVRAKQIIFKNHKEKERP
jgi:hypothetical protein